VKRITIRTLVTEAVIGAAVCAGGYFMLVEPMEREIAQTRQEIAAVQSLTLPDALAPLAAPDAQRLVNSTAGLRKQVADRSATALTEAGIFAAIVATANKHGLRIDEVLPIATRVSKTAPPPAPVDAAAPMVASALPATGKSVQRAYSISAMGPYPSVASFLQALQNDLGLTVVRAVRITPDTTPGSSNVLCSIETEHWALPLPGPQVSTTTTTPDTLR